MTTIAFPVYFINAFTQKLFSGNPAMVCILPHWLPEQQLQKIAIENNLPATAFLVRTDSRFETRWFAPEYEIDLCGHGSLSSAYVIFNILEPNWHEVELNYPAGKLLLKKSADLLTLDFPAKISTEITCSDVIKQSLGLEPSACFEYKHERCLIVLESEEQVAKLSPNLDLLKSLPYRGFIVTAKGNEVDFVSRTFYPKKAISEDAVTGSSHCLLIPYWANKLNKTKFLAKQISPRGGEIKCELKGERVYISGQAVKYLEGIMTINN